MEAQLSLLIKSIMIVAIITKAATEDTMRGTFELDSELGITDFAIKVLVQIII